MRPGEFLALLREGEAEPEAEPAPAPARVYRAVEVSAAAEHFLTVHTPGRIAAFPYGGLSQISGDHPAGALYRLRFATLYVDLEGLNLAPVFEAIRTRRAAHVHQLDAERHDPPEEGAAVVLGVQFHTIKQGGGTASAKAEAAAKP